MGGIHFCESLNSVSVEEGCNEECQSCIDECNSCQLDVSFGAGMSQSKKEDQSSSD